jgi:glycosyltransferase involved in cell wall biosynthesis
VFVALEYFVPGYKAGGPLRSIWNLVLALGDQFDFYVYTRDRDDGDDRPFVGVRRDAWQQVGKARVFYASPSRLSSLSLARAIADVRPHAIYLNSAFAPMTLRVLILRKLGIVQQPIVVAPRNELSPGALSLKAGKKHAFLSIGRRIALYRGLIWQCSNDAEATQVRDVFPAARTVIACDIAATIPEIVVSKEKERGHARLVYLSRISPKKNLLTALHAVRTCTGTVTFDIYGPVQDEEYWNECLELMSAMPPHVTVKYCGPLEPQRIPDTLASYHYFVLPTLSENFGHAIHEALSLGLPVLIGSDTPWTGVGGMKAGWIVRSDVHAWAEAIEAAIQTDADEFRSMVKNARQVALTCGGVSHAVEANLRLLTSTIAG